MNCKRCGAPLPSQGYVCSQCGMFMSSEQIEIQKQYMKNNNDLRAELVSEKYGGKKEIYQSREVRENKGLAFLALFGVLIFIIIIAIIVYFL